MDKLVKKTYTVSIIEHPDNKVEMNRVNDGFNALELLGIVSLTQHEIIEQMKGNIKPDVINRTVITKTKQHGNKKRKTNC